MKLSNKPNSKKIFVWALCILAIFLFIFLGIKNYPFQGQYQIVMDLGYDTSLITKLGPPPRVSLEGDYQKVFEGPVYFDVRILPWYNKAQVYITYQDNGQVFENMGIQTAPGFNYMIVEPIFLNNIDGEYKKAMVEFDLSNGYKDKNFSRFLISTSQTDPVNRGWLEIKSIKVILKI